MHGALLGAVALIAAPRAQNAQLDIMVLYTEEAGENLETYGDPKTAETEIEEAAAYLNQAFDNSEITITANIVHTAAIAFTPSDNDGESLQWLTLPNDGIIDEVHQLRDQHAADIVVLISSGGSVTGIGGFSQGNDTRWEAEAFCIVFVGNDMTEMDDRTFAHEIGHVMGGMHDWYAGPHLSLSDGDEVNPSISHNKGYVYIDPSDNTGFYTIMAYARMAADLEAECEAIPYFSNPAVSYNGVPTGTVAVTPSWDIDADCYEATESILDCNCPADIASAFNWMASTLTAYRSAEGPDGAVAAVEVQLSGLHEVTVSWEESIGNETGFRIYRSIDAGWNFFPVDSVGADVTEYVDPINDIITAGKSWIYRVQAVNAAGLTTYSEDSLPAPVDVSQMPVSEDFEDGLSDDLAWVNDQYNPWHIVEHPDGEGSALKGSDDLGFMGWTGEASAPDFAVRLIVDDGFVVFDIKTDALVQFFIDSSFTKHSAWSLTDGWETVAVPIDSGDHEIRWEFMGGGNAYIDNIRFPADARAVASAPRARTVMPAAVSLHGIVDHGAGASMRCAVPARYAGEPYALSLLDVKGREVRILRSGRIPHSGLAESVRIEAALESLAPGLYVGRLRIAGTDHIAALPRMR
jgi:hypothetical protein